jgi:hypothetical protein
MRLVAVVSHRREIGLVINMEPIAIVILFFMVLAVFIAASAFSQKKSTRVVSALATFGWACLMFIAAN